MRRIKNPDLLRERVKRIESKIKTIANKKYNGKKFPQYTWDKGPLQKSKVKELLHDRAMCLDRMFKGTPEEVKRFEMLNDKFLRMADDMRARAAMLWESLQGMKKMEGYDATYEVEGFLYVDTNIHGQKEPYVIRLFHISVYVILYTFFVLIILTRFPTYFEWMISEQGLCLKYITVKLSQRGIQ